MKVLFDLLLFFIERDELDIYNIPISKITKDFLDYIHHMKSLNIELASEFILFIATLMRIKAKMLLPRKELDEQGNEIDPRLELVDKILEYKRFKQAAAELAEKEAERMLQIKRGNIARELSEIGEVTSEGTEVQTLTLFKLTKTFEKVMQRIKERDNKPQHVVYKVTTIPWKAPVSSCWTWPVQRKHWPLKKYSTIVKTVFMPSSCS